MKLSLQMVDAEFARVGPCAYDMGLLLATLLLLYHHHRHVHHENHPQGEVKAVPSEQKHMEESSPLEKRCHSSAEAGVGQRRISQLSKDMKREDRPSRDTEEKCRHSRGVEGDGGNSRGTEQECGQSGGVEQESGQSGGVEQERRHSSGSVEDTFPDKRSSKMECSHRDKAQLVLNMCSAMSE